MCNALPDRQSGVSKSPGWWHTEAGRWRAKGTKKQSDARFAALSQTAMQGLEVTGETRTHGRGSQTCGASSQATELGWGSRGGEGVSGVQGGVWHEGGRGE